MQTICITGHQQVADGAWNIGVAQLAFENVHGGLGQLMAMSKTIALAGNALVEIGHDHLPGYAG
ncbi:hypothetical protein NBRC116588_13180 [Pyruvatibacter sp. HU-CL02332]